MSLPVLLSILLAPPALAGDAAPGEPPEPPLHVHVADVCGPLGVVEELGFTFVVVKDGEEKARRQHTWWPQESRITVARDGVETTLQLVSSMPTTAEDPRWPELAPGVVPEEAQAAWSAFVNDQYWLLAPCKVTDPGVKLSEEAPTEAGLRVLSLSFDGVGLTPGDRYWLEVDDHGQVQGWRFVLQSGREGAFRWSEHTLVGPLQLSLQREATEGDFVIRFEDVRAR